MLSAPKLNPSFFVCLFTVYQFFFHLFCQCLTSLKLMLITGLPTGKPSYKFVFGHLSRKTITQGREDKRSGTEKRCSQPLGMIHSTKILTSLTRRSGPAQKVDHGLVFSKLFWLDRTDPLSFGTKFPEILVEWIAPLVSYDFSLHEYFLYHHFGGQNFGY